MALNDDEEKKLKDEHAAGLKSKEDEIAKLKADLEKAGKKGDPEPDDKDLTDKARLAREEAEKNKIKTKELESALKFNLSLTDFVKSNKDILPSEVEDLLKESEKEKYDSAFDKAAALKSGIIKVFFSVQANLDFVTASQKAQIEDYLKLTINGRLEKAAQIYENIFEPALETMKKVKKAEELGKASSGHAGASKHENAYKEKLMQVSRKTHLGEKGV